MVGVKAYRLLLRPWLGNRHCRCSRFFRSHPYPRVTAATADKAKCNQGQNEACLNGIHGSPLAFPSRRGKQKLA